MKATLFEAFITYVLPLLATAVGTALTWSLKKLADHWGAQAQTSKVSALGNKLAVFANMIVQEVEHTVRAQLKVITADGKITPEEARELKTLAVGKLIAVLGDKGLKELHDLMGVNRDALPDVLGGLIERAVGEIPSRGVTVSSTPVLTGLKSDPFVNAPGGLPPARP